MKERLIIREYRATDAEAVRTLLRQLGYDRSLDGTTTNIAQVRDHGGTIFVASIAGDTCGCICVVLDARLAEGLYGELVSLVVSEKHRGSGIGKALVAHAENHLKRYTDKIRVRANVLRHDAHRFYSSMGYVDRKEQKVFTKKL